jgi:hypothetical protein
MRAQARWLDYYTPSAKAVVGGRINNIGRADADPVGQPSAGRAVKLRR